MKSPVNFKLFVLLIIIIGISLFVYFPGGRYSYYVPVKPTLATVPVHENGHGLPSEQRLLPLSYWEHRNTNPDKYTQTSCSQFPWPEDIQYAATSWQYLPIINGSVYMYAAYWDDRWDQAIVRVLIYSDTLPMPKLYCYLWYEEETNPVTTTGTPIYAWTQLWGGGQTDGVNEPYILSCKPRHNKRPAAVSVATELCEQPKNALAVQGEPSSKGPRPSHRSTSVGMCFKWLDYAHDVSGPLSEWIELLQAFGAHPNTKKLLQYYESRGVIQLQQYFHPPQLLADKFSAKQRHIYDWRTELIPLNDCLYRAVSSRELRWLGVFDVDELLVPVRDGNYHVLVQKEVDATLKSAWPDALVFLNYYFLDGAQREKAAPPPARILAHVWRSKEHNKPGVIAKSIVSVNSVVTMHQHMPLKCGKSNGNCNARYLKEDVGRLYHYRTRCRWEKDNCTELHDVVRDDTMLKWSYVLTRVSRVLTYLDIPIIANVTV